MKKNTKPGQPRHRHLIIAVVSNLKGDIFDLEGYAAVGMAGEILTPLTRNRTIDLPHGSELMMLPDRHPILYNIHTGKPEILDKNPYAPNEPIFPVAAFNSPGYVISQVSAYKENHRAGYLPLFSYGAVGWCEGKFRSAAIRVDREPRQDLRLMPREKVVSGVEKMRRALPDNRLRAHLETCALTYGCPAGKNFFLGRYEAPLPTSTQCNARCLGCISRQDNTDISPCQERIGFTPTSREIAAVALAHIRRVKHAVVSFGQGCEGDPLLAAHEIEPAIRLIRKATDKGTINMNTNGSLPDIMAQLFDAGLDSFRVSMNSVRKATYEGYFRPRGYGFEDVLKSIDIALAKEKFVSINYLNCPGFTDSAEEMDAFFAFLEKYPVHHIQWRNLNYDPVRYWDAMNSIAAQRSPRGMGNLLQTVRRQFPDLTFGYFNPPKEKWKRLGDRMDSSG